MVAIARRNFGGGGEIAGMAAKRRIGRKGGWDGLKKGKIEQEGAEERLVGRFRLGGGRGTMGRCLLL
jgi:hypothetical protein